MKLSIMTMLLLFSFAIKAGMANEIRIVNVSFPGPGKPKTEVDRNRNWYTNHFSVSGSYKTEVEVECNIPMNTAFNVRVYAIVLGNPAKVTGDVRSLEAYR